MRLYREDFKLIVVCIVCRLDRKTGKLGMSFAQFHSSEIGPFGRAILRLLRTFRLVTMETNVGENKDEIRVNNLTIINLVLKACGQTHEQTLTLYLMGIQVGGGEGGGGGGERGREGGRLMIAKVY